MGVKINDLPVVRWGVNKNMVGEDGYPQDAFCYYCGLNLHTECVENVRRGICDSCMGQIYERDKLLEKFPVERMERRRGLFR